MPYTVVFTPEAETQLTDLYGYIAAEASPGIAERFTDDFVTFCESLTTLPLRGVKREDIRPGIRITNYRRRVVVAFTVDADRANIIGISYGGRDYEAALVGDEVD